MITKQFTEMKSKIKHYRLLAAFLLSTPLTITAQDFYKEQRSHWLQKAELSKPVLIETVKHPISLVSIVKDENVFQHWKVVRSDPVDSLYNNSFKKQ